MTDSVDPDQTPRYSEITVQIIMEIRNEETQIKMEGGETITVNMAKLRVDLVI